MIVQIYGFTVPEDVLGVSDLSVDHMGVVLDEGVDTWDRVDLPTARALLDAMPPTTKRVALSLSTDPGRVRRTVELLEPDIVHLARAGALGPESVARLRPAISPVTVMVTVPVDGPEALAAARTFGASCDFLLLDTADPATGVVGATGVVHDWALSARIAESATVPVILAGGLGPENVRRAAAKVRPDGVDSETRTSLDGDRRRKDPDKVRRFVERARSMGSGASPSRVSPPA